MSRRMSRISTARGPLGCHLIATIILGFVIGFIVLSRPASLEAQDATQGTKPGPSTPDQQPATVTPLAPQVDELEISPQDVLDIYVYDVPELSRSYDVSPLGMVTLPLLDQPVHAAGLTPDQFARALEEAFRQSGRLRRPEISVAIKQTRNSTVAVDGAIKLPQVLQVTRQTKLVDILSQCGGLGEDAGSEVTITRGPLALRDLRAAGEQASPTLTLDLKKVLDGNDPASLTAVWPGDRVSVGRAGVFYVLGDVTRPGGYTLKENQSDFTVLQALAIAGDVNSTAKKNKALIIRKDPKAANGRQEIALNLKEILAGRSPDPKMQPNDILFVPTSGGKRALHTLTGVPAAITTEAAAAAILVH